MDPGGSLDATDKSLLIVDDDKPFQTRLARAMEARGFVVTTADSVAEGAAAVRRSPPAFAIIDMRLGDGNGLDAVSYTHLTLPTNREV